MSDFLHPASPVAPGQVARLEARRLALWLALVPAVVVGFARFGYALILPAMRADLGWSLGHAGALNTANALGYFLGALCAAPVMARLGAKRSLLCGLGGVVGTLAASGATDVYGLLLGTRALVGFASALAFVAGAGLTARLSDDEGEAALLMGIYFGGPGLGVVVTGLILPFFLGGKTGTHRWPMAWELLAALGLMATLAVGAAIKGLPEVGVSAPGTATNPVRSDQALWRGLGSVLAAYFCFGLGYIAYMTFLVAYVRGLGADARTVAMVWTTLGAVMAASGLLWRRPLAVWRSGAAMALMLLGICVAALLPMLSSGLATLLLSAALFGWAAMPVVTAVTVAIRRRLSRGAWNAGIALATVWFALGQSLGPLGAGALSDRFGLKASLIWTAGACLLGVAFARRHFDPQ